jgi:hypothetical protein
MPFTFAHPLVILPLGKRKSKYFDFTALIVGSMAPDFEYFIHFRPYQLYGHSILGQLYYNLPLVVIVSIIWYYILQKPIISNLPKPYNTYFFYLTKKTWRINSIRSIIVFIYSSFIGMISHLLWDSFTHMEGYFVTKMTILSQSVSLMNSNIPIYKLLQHGSTVMGLTIIMVYLLSIQDKTSKYEIIVNKPSKLIFWLSIVLIDIIIVGIVVLIKDDFSIGRIVVSFLSGGFIGATIISMFFKMSKVRRKHLYNV